jgi:ferritin-like metal-binding protein YciE
MGRTADEQIVKYLTDLHSIEEQALQQLRKAPDIAGDDDLAAVFREHLKETEVHERRVRERLEACGGDPSKTKDLIARVGGIGMVLFARSQPDTPGKLVAHAFSYEHMEFAAYDLLARVAEQLGDTETAALARSIRQEEDAMAGRLAERFDLAVAASLRDQDPDDLREQLTSYLADAHAIESQAIGLLDKGADLVDEPGLARAFEDHLEETRGHMAKLEQRLEALDSQPSRFKDTALRMGALNLGGFFAAQPDTPAKLAGFAFAFEHIEIAAYELLKRVAERAADADTVRVADEILAEERRAAEMIRARFDQAVDASLAAQGVGA